MWRKAAAAAIAAVAAWLLYDLVAMRHHCNVIEGEVSRSVETIPYDPARIFAYRGRAARNVERIAACAERHPSDVNLRMLAASNLTILGRHDAAAAMLRRALEFDRRPELYLALALAEIELGQREQAIQHAALAAEFSGLSRLQEISDGMVRVEAQKIAGTRLEGHLIARGDFDTTNRLLNGDFAGGRAHWRVTAAQHSPVTVMVVPSTRRAGANALRVIASGGDSGVFQLWTKPPVPRARTTAWVYVVRGQVYVGTGSGQPPMRNVLSAGTGRWEKLEAVSESCPADRTVVFSASPEGAEFILDEITARETLAAPPC